MNWLFLSTLLLSSCDALAVQRQTGPTPGARLPSGTEIRLLPIGDSITHGTNTDGTAYRGQLYRNLEGNVVDFTGVASQANGNMPDPDNAGWGGYTIAQIEAAADSGNAYVPTPNVVCLHAGTNDMLRGEDDGAPARLETLLNKITTAAPDALVLVAKIVPSTFADVNARVSAYNEQIEEVVARAQQNGQFKIVFVDMSQIEISGDGIHPSDAGYNAMGDVWFNAIWNWDSAGFISPPV